MLQLRVPITAHSSFFFFAERSRRLRCAADVLTVTLSPLQGRVAPSCGAGGGHSAKAITAKAQRTSRMKSKRAARPSPASATRINSSRRNRPSRRLAASSAGK